MSRGTKLIIIIVAGLIAIAVIIVYFVKIQKETWPKEKVVDETAPVEKVAVEPEKDIVIKLPPPTEEEKQAASLKTISLIFVEKFGTYTNQSDYSNIQELASTMTKPMAEWAINTYIPKLKKEHDPAGFFYRIITEAPVAEIIERSETAAKVKVSTQRQETIGEAEPRIFLQDMILDLVKENGSWLIDAAYWQ